MRLRAATAWPPGRRWPRADYGALLAACSLAALEAPFQRFYAAYDGYREALTAWRARHREVVIVTTADSGGSASRPRRPMGPTPP